MLRLLILKIRSNQNLSMNFHLGLKRMITYFANGFFNFFVI